MSVSAITVSSTIGRLANGQQAKVGILWGEVAQLLASSARSSTYICRSHLVTESLASAVCSKSAPSQATVLQLTAYARRIETGKAACLYNA